MALLRRSASQARYPILGSLTLLLGFQLVIVAQAAEIERTNSFSRIADLLPGFLQRGLGSGMLQAAPWLMKALSVAGTAAMFLVGGGILTHGITPLHHLIEQLAERAGGLLAPLIPLLADAVLGVSTGALVLLAVSLLKKVWPAKRVAIN